MSKPRIRPEEYRKINEILEKETIPRSESFTSLIGSLPKADPVSSCPLEINKTIKIIEELKKYNFNLFDICYNYQGFVSKTTSDTHSKNRAFEKFMGGKGDGKSNPDFESHELKLIQVVKNCHDVEQVLTIGKMFPGNYSENCLFEDSACYKKLKRMLVVTYKREGKQLGREIQSYFLFEIDTSPWYNQIKEDWEFYQKEYQAAKRRHEEQLASNPKHKKKASGIMKSDMGLRCPNGKLGIRTDGIIFTKKFFKEVSEYYVK